MSGHLRILLPFPLPCCLSSQETVIHLSTWDKSRGCGLTRRPHGRCGIYGLSSYARLATIARGHLWRYDITLFLVMAWLPTGNKPLPGPVTQFYVIIWCHEVNIAPCSFISQLLERGFGNCQYTWCILSIHWNLNLSSLNLSHSSRNMKATSIEYVCIYKELISAKRQSLMLFIAFENASYSCTY